MFPERGRGGHTLVELLVGMLVLGLLTTVSIGLLAVELRLVREAASLAEAGNAARFAARLLRAELRPVVPGPDVRGQGLDSTSQRVFRGSGIVCSASGTSAEVRYRGIRDPDPAKDSVLLLTPAGEFAAPLVSVGPPAAPACVASPGELRFHLAWADTLVPGPTLLVFESGTWHLSGGALRYERGAGGRQPVTAAVLNDDSTDITAEAVAGATTAIRLRLSAAPAGSPARHGLLRILQRIGLLNLPIPLDSAVLDP